MKIDINKAKISCQNSGISVFEHCVDVDKTIKMPKGAEKTIIDYELHYVKNIISL